MTDRELVEALHTRMAARRKNRARRKTAALSTGCAGLTMFLLAFIFGQGILHESRTAGLYSGAMLMFGNAGAYVAVAIIAFMVGVAITALCIRYRLKHESGIKTEQGTTEKERERT